MLKLLEQTISMHHKIEHLIPKAIKIPCPKIILYYIDINT